MVKREAEDELIETSSEDDTDKTAVETPRKRAKQPSSSTPRNKSKSSPSMASSPFPPSSSNTRSAKSKLGEMIIECGIKNLSRPEAQIRTGLTPAQQAEMLKVGRGSLRKALMTAIEKL